MRRPPCWHAECSPPLRCRYTLKREGREVTEPGQARAFAASMRRLLDKQVRPALPLRPAAACIAAVK